MSKIYLAGSCSVEQRTLMKNVATALRNSGLEVYYPFEQKIPNAWDMSQELWAKEVFENDTKAIQRCNSVVVISLGRESTAGTNWEQGYAYGIGKPTYVFQITEKPTSVMTYWGCTRFTVTDKNSLCKTVLCVLGGIDDDRSHSCPTTLT